MVEENDPQAGASKIAKRLKREHLEGTYNASHPRCSHAFDDALMNATQGTIDATGEYNINYILLDIIKEYLTFHQVWKKIENGLGSKATRSSCQLALITQLGDVRMFNSDAQKLIQEIRTIQAKSIHHLNFDALTVALSTCQSAIESVPTQKWDPQQANARITSSTEQGDSAKETDANGTKTTWSKHHKICCYVYSGASFHMINNHSILINPKTCQKHVFTAGSEVLEATAVGDINISTAHGDVFLQNVLYVRNLNVNLLSTNSLMDEGAQVILDHMGGQIYLANGTLLKISKDHDHGLLELQGDTW
ncbi:uncharacterized protein UHO2_06467 [Ustilago hordei]|uniref:uncharacterized protein n=1 Tax=Ustilago hordei TaxID=120017 RepID=UPI001A3989ED|nr:uncharacterized protein UHO2_06467 [Ustilago hordei]SYW77171.1 uncharacterized protein UHO2_06467 [Ustilago hordei]